MRLAILLACCLLPRGISSQVEEPRPKFSDFLVKDIYRGKPARPIITKEFRSFRTAIRGGARSDVEFAGRYTVPGWGCGTDCQPFVIVDSVSGKAYDLPSDWLEKHGGYDAKIERVEFHPNSRLMKINACQMKRTAASTIM